MSIDEPLTPFHIAVQVRDIDEARRFYKDILGCAEGRSDTHWVDFNLYGHQFVCHLNPNLGAAGKLDEPFQSGGRARRARAPLRRRAAAAAVDRVGRAPEAPRREFVIEPHTRFKGQVGEQSTMFFLDPTGNALEFKAFQDIETQLFATR